jgi:hypothetical protein
MMGWFPEECGCIFVSYTVYGYVKVCKKHHDEGRRVREKDVYGDPLDNPEHPWNIRFEGETNN